MRTNKPQLSIVVQSPSDEAPQREGRKAAAHKDTIIVFLSVMVFMVLTWWVPGAPLGGLPGGWVTARAPGPRCGSSGSLHLPARRQRTQHRPTPLLPTAPQRPPPRRFFFVHRLYLNHLHDGEDMRQNVVIKLQKGGQ